MADYLFVYGTLRPALCHPAYKRLLQGKTTIIEQASVPGQLVDLGDFPGLISLNHSDDEVTGDVLALPEENRDSLLSRLDSYEGALFERTRATACLPGGTELEVFIYEFVGDVDEQPRITDGDFVQHVLAQQGT